MKKRPQIFNYLYSDNEWLTPKSIATIVISCIVGVVINLSAYMYYEKVQMTNYIGQEGIKWIDDLKAKDLDFSKIIITQEKNIDKDGQEYQRTILKDEKQQKIFEAQWIMSKKNEYYGREDIEIQKYYVAKRCLGIKQNYLRPAPKENMFLGW